MGQCAPPRLNAKASNAKDQWHLPRSPFKDSGSLPRAVAGGEGGGSAGGPLGEGRAGLYKRARSGANGTLASELGREIEKRSLIPIGRGMFSWFVYGFFLKFFLDYLELNEYVNGGFF